MIAELLLANLSAFEVEAATRAYLTTLDGPARAQSDAYFEGGYWLPLWGVAMAGLVDWLLLNFRLSAAFRTLGERWLTRSFGVTWFTALLFVIAAWIISLPWLIYTEFVRERQYDLLDQSFGGWFVEQLVALGFSLLVLPLVIAASYALIRRAPRRWWLWTTGLVGAVLLGMIVIHPVFVAPAFNTYTELEPGPLRTRIEAMAAKYDIPAVHILVFDQSKQHKRISANVSGLGPTIRISLNDNLLKRTSDEEVLAVLGHEMGHYKLNHVWHLFAVILAIIAACLYLTHRSVPWIIRRWGGRWGVRDLADPASLPVLAFCLSVLLTVGDQLVIHVVRANESAADAFGLDAAREPDGFARVAMRLSEYRKIEPGPIEEFLFFDHPSGATRVRMAMEWKAKNVPNAQIVAPPKGYLDAK